MDYQFSRAKTPFTTPDFTQKYGIQNLYDPVKYILDQPGKKIRYHLTLLACELFSGTDEKALNAAVAIEIFHNFTLVHDDVMDNADTRRGLQSIHKKWDINTAILSGDVMLILAYDSLLKCPVKSLPAVLSNFSQTGREVCEGQQLDMDFENMPAVQMDAYLEMIRKKTAVLLGSALYIGAKCGGACDSDAQYLYEFGVNLGIAFQIRDDILDCYGDKKKVGKLKGGDILQGKKTILYIRTWNGLPPEEQRFFEKLYHGQSENKVEEVMKWFQKTEAKSYALEAEKKHFRKSINSLKKVNVSDERARDLFDFAHDLMDRDH